MKKLFILILIALITLSTGCVATGTLGVKVSYTAPLTVSLEITLPVAPSPAPVVETPVDCPAETKSEPQ